MPRQTTAPRAFDPARNIADSHSSGSHHRAMRCLGRNGRLNSLWSMLLGAIGLMIVLTALLLRGGPEKSQSPVALTIYCAAGLRNPVEQIAEQYEADYGVRINLQFGGSNTLLNQIEVNRYDTADLFLAADGMYTDQAVAKGLAAETLPIAEARPVVAVRRGNPKQIQSLDDLLKSEVTVAVPSPDQAAVGQAARKALERAVLDGTNRWLQLEEQVTRRGVFKPTVNDVANDVKMGAVDAGIVWDFLVAGPGYRNELEAISLPELSGEPSLVSVAILTSTHQATAALRFARYLTARDRGLPVFQEAGLRPVDGDVWAEQPAITFFCGAVNRRAVDHLVSEFAAREGVVVNTVYDGCGTLTGRMRTIQNQRTNLGFPDMYMACDLYHLQNVADWFQEAATVSSAEIVIAVPRGSRKVTRLEDLLLPGIRVSVGEPDQCTIGALTRRLLVDKGLYDRLKEKQVQSGEVVVEKPSSALLVPDVTTGHVDAAVAYVTDAMANRDKVDIVRIDSTLNRAVQPLSVSKTSDHKYLVRRLYQLVTNSPDAFKSAGFEFQFTPAVSRKPAEIPGRGTAADAAAGKAARRE